MRKPNFFLVGAPKCGTSSLAKWLRSHPSVYMSPIKEPNFFNTDHLDIHRPSSDEYVRLFNGATHHDVAVGEASPWYLYSNDAIPDIVKYSPDAKLIVCLRHPIAMAYSLHNQSLFAGTECLANFEEAWRAQGERARCVNVPRHTEPLHLLYGPICKLGEQVARAQRLAGIDRVFPIFLDDMRKDPWLAYRQVLRFLGVPDDHRPDFRPENPAQRRKYPRLRNIARRMGAAKRALGVRGGLGLLDRLDRWNRAPHRWQADPAMASELRSYFREDIALLAAVTGRDLSHWLAGEPEPEVRVK